MSNVSIFYSIKIIKQKYYQGKCLNIKMCWGFKNVKKKITKKKKS